MAKFCNLESTQNTLCSSRDDLPLPQIRCYKARVLMYSLLFLLLLFLSMLPLEETVSSILVIYHSMKIIRALVDWKFIGGGFISKFMLCGRLTHVLQCDWRPQLSAGCLWETMLRPVGQYYNSLPCRFQGMDVHFGQHQESSFNLELGTVPHLKALSQLIQDHWTWYLLVKCKYTDMSH